jgi:hypothetical protein
MSKTRTLVVAGVASIAMALSALGSATAAGATEPAAAPGPEPTISVSALTGTPKLPVCKPPDCRYA